MPPPANAPRPTDWLLWGRMSGHGAGAVAYRHGRSNCVLWRHHSSRRTTRLVLVHDPCLLVLDPPSDDVCDVLLQYVCGRLAGLVCNVASAAARDLMRSSQERWPERHDLVMQRSFATCANSGMVAIYDITRCLAKKKSVRSTTRSVKAQVYSSPLQPLPVHQCPPQNRYANMSHQSSIFEGWLAGPRLYNQPDKPARRPYAHGWWVSSSLPLLHTSRNSR